jgi:Uma2 family endonuclease
MANSTTEWTYAEYARLPDDGNRYEVIDGEVCVTPAPGPNHQEIAARIDLELKPSRYRTFGVPEYWVADPARRSVEVFRFRDSPKPEVVTSALRWQPDPSFPALKIEVASVFDEA